MKIYFSLLLSLIFHYNGFSQIDPCSNLQTIFCGTQIQFTSTGNGNTTYRNNNPCFYNLNNSVGGEEAIYLFTAPQKGFYELVIDSTNGGNVNYGWKDTTGGCNNSNWNCIDYSNTAGCIGAITLDSGQTIYLLLNAIQTTAVHYFKLECGINNCNTISVINCGDTIAFTSSCYGDETFRNNTPCFYNLNNSQGGQEMIYEFTAPETGYYQATLLSSTGGTVNYGWKDKVLGCDGTNWNCFNHSDNPGCLGAMSLDSGQTVYILANAIPITQIAHTFKIECVIDICSNIPAINCGDTVAFLSSCYGDETNRNNTPCFYNLNNSQGGQEIIYEFTAPATGYYEATLISATGGTVNYGWKDKSLGCDTGNWNCFNYSDTPGCLGAMSLDSGQTVYILANAIPTSPVFHQFKIECVVDVCQNIPVINCGDTILFSKECYGDENYRNNDPCFYNLNNNQGGREVIYRLPPSNIGYQLSVILANGGSVNYGWKYDSLGCDPLTWNCLGITSTTATYSFTSIDSCLPLLLILNAINTATITHEFTVSCGACSTVGISENETGITFGISPNPVSEQLYITLNHKNKASLIYFIYDITGKELLKGVAPAVPAFEIDVKALSGGYYLLRIVDSIGNSVSKAFVK